MESDIAEGLVVKIKRFLLAPSLGKGNGRLTAVLCTFRVIDRGKSEARVPSSRDHRHVEFLLDCACTEKAREDRESLMCRFSKHRWLVARDKEYEDAPRRWIVGKLVNEVITRDVQALAVESDQEVKFDLEASIADMKNTLTGDLRSVGGLSSVSIESPVGASAANAVMEKSVWEMQSTVKTIVAYSEWVYGATSDPGSVISNWTVEIVGHLVSRSQSSVPDVRTACERRKRKSNRKALVQFNELEMHVTIE